MGRSRHAASLTWFLGMPSWCLVKAVLTPSLMVTGSPVFSGTRSMAGMTLFRCPAGVSGTSWSTCCWILASCSGSLARKSANDWLVFLVLHFSQAVTRLPTTVGPLLDAGMTWSSVSFGLVVAGALHK